MTDDQRYQNWLRVHGLEQQQAIDDITKSCVEAVRLGDVAAVPEIYAMMLAGLGLIRSFHF